MKISHAALSLLFVTPFTWYANWFWGLPLVVLTVVIHVFGLLLIDERIEHVERAAVERHGYSLVFVAVVGTTAMLAALLHGLEGVIWATAFRLLGALPDYADAALYSLGAMTTYGHADVVLEKRWQFMGPLEALDGWLLFGLTTAFLIGIIQRTRQLRARRSP
jgi:hypothetical protein